MSIRKTAATGAALAISAAGLVALNTAPAQAATGYARCPSGYMCVFAGLDGKGTIGMFKKGDGNLGDAYGPQNLNNNIESVWNRTDQEWLLFNNAGYSGGITVVDTKAKTNIPKKYRNITSSLQGARY